MVSGAEVHMNQRGETEFLRKEKNFTRWYSLLLTEHLWRSNGECDSEEEGGAFQQWK